MDLGVCGEWRGGRPIIRREVEWRGRAGVLLLDGREMEGGDWKGGEGSFY